MTLRTLGWPQLLLALAIVAVWGSNFVVIKLALGHLPPLLFATLRFALAAVPIVFGLRRPAVPWRNLAAYGVLIGIGQFGLLYIALNGLIAPGLASLVVQSQVFFTIGLAVWISRERLQTSQYVALALSVAGIAVIAAHTGQTTTLGGLLLVLVAALGWAGGNIVQRATPAVNMLGYVVWSSLFAVPPLLLLSLVFEGPAQIGAALSGASLAIWGAVVWQSVGNTMFGYAAWGWLLGRYPAATIAPLALLVPVFGMGTAAWWLGEPLPLWKLGAAALVIGGLALNLLWPQLRRRVGQRMAVSPSAQ
jgi:O-acetylserine/cysteine efflux transporter